jgi:DNA-binding beta-propeller fold protein YncE
MRRAALVLVCLLVPAAVAAQSSTSLFESGQVRPLARTPDGLHLLAVDTPDSQLEIYDIAGNGTLTHAASVQVGLEPVAVAARTSSEIWVVNHLSDSVSIVSLSGTPRVVRTLWVGDEPNDVVFAGTNDRWAFVTSAHRGQNSPHDGRDFAQAGIGRADIWVFDATALGTSAGGDEVAVLTAFGDKPRALAVSPDKQRVYAAVFHSGNRTTSLFAGLLCPTSSANANADVTQGPCTLDDGETSLGGYPAPNRDHSGVRRPETGLIVKQNRDGASPSKWQDELGRDWSSLVRFGLPDRDVFEIDANANPPRLVDGSSTCANGAGCWAGVGTVLFDMVANPVTGVLYVSNTDAQNQVRFEGPGSFAASIKPAGEPATVQGNLAHARITVLSGSSVAPRHLNKHIDYAIRPASAATKAKSLSTPMGMAVTPDGSTLYVAAFGSGKIGRFDTAALEADSFVPDAAGQISLSGGGPSGLVLSGNRLYVLTRFDNAVAVVDTASGLEIQKLALHTPEPEDVVDGRRFLYDAQLTSSNGEASCASCHIFGDMDDLAWDLGNPDGDVVTNTNPFNPLIPANFDPLPHVFHAMKGPMTTQSLHGLENHGPEHWRGDRQGDEVAAFEAFNAAFPNLIGRATPLAAADMTAFRKFALKLRYPPNPIRNLDGTLQSDEASGRSLYFNTTTDTIATCNGCHVVDAAQGFFGGDGRSIFDGESQHLKIPHLRNMYQKVGMFGMAHGNDVAIGGLRGIQLTGSFANQGNQIRGFGYVHDGSIDNLLRFFGLSGFSLTATQESNVAKFMMAMDSDFAPIVGQQVTLTAANGATAGPRIDLLIARAQAPFTSQVLGGAVRECDLVASVVESGRERGYLYQPATNRFAPDDGGAGLTDAALRAKAAVAGQEITYTCAPPGSGARLALDRDEDGLLDGFETDTGVFVSATDTGTSPASADTDGDGVNDAAEVAAGTDPTDPHSFPGAPQVPALPTAALAALLAAMLAASRPRLARSRR